MKILKVNRKGAALSEKQLGKVDGGYKYRRLKRLNVKGYYALSKDEVRKIRECLPDGKEFIGPFKGSSIFSEDALSEALGCEQSDIDRVLQEKYNFKYEGEWGKSQL